MGLFKRLTEVFTPERAQAVHYQCHNCDRRFVYRVDLSDPTCPYCDSPDIDAINGS